MGRESGVCEDRASRSSDCSITTYKESWDTLRLGREVIEVRRSRGARGREESNGRGLGGQVDPTRFRVTAQGQGPGGGGEISRVLGRARGVAHLPTSALSSRLRSTVVSPRILFTSGSSGSGTSSSTSSHSDGESQDMACPGRRPPTRGPGWDLRDSGSGRRTSGSSRVARSWAPPAPAPPLPGSSGPASSRPPPSPTLVLPAVPKRINAPRNHRSLARSLLPRFWPPVSGCGSWSLSPGAGQWGPGP